MIIENKQWIARRAHFAVVISLMIASPAAAQKTMGDFTDIPSMPTTPTAKLAQRVLDTINSNDPAQVRLLVEEAFSPRFRDSTPIKAHEEAFASFYNFSQGFEFVAVRNYEIPLPDNEIIVIVRNKMTSAFRGIHIVTDGGEPPRVESFMLNPARPPVSHKLPVIRSDNDIVRELRSYVENLARKDAFCGSVLVAHDGKVLFEYAAGLADRTRNLRNRADTKFSLASMNKMFTAVAIAQLAEKGKLSFNDSVAEHLGSDWIGPAAAKEIRIKHLLSHTSGLGDFLDKVQPARDRLREINDYKELIKGSTPMFAPGSRWSYSNTGFLLLGAIIEKVSGQNYYDYIRENIYSPAGMSNTDSFEYGGATPNMAIGYTRKRTNSSDSRWVEATDLHARRGTSAGGGFSTVRDLLKFDRALRDGKLINPQTLKEMWSPKPASPAYGLGFDLTPTPVGKVAGHAGGFPGVSTQMDMYVESGYCIVVLCNIDSSAYAVAEHARSLINAKK